MPVGMKLPAQSWERCPAGRRETEGQPGRERGVQAVQCQVETGQVPDRGEEEPAREGEGRCQAGWEEQGGGGEVSVRMGGGEGPDRGKEGRCQTGWEVPGGG